MKKCRIFLYIFFCVTQRVYLVGAWRPHLTIVRICNIILFSAARVVRVTPPNSARQPRRWDQVCHSWRNSLFLFLHTISVGTCKISLPHPRGRIFKNQDIFCDQRSDLRPCWPGLCCKQECSVRGQNCVFGWSAACFACRIVWIYVDVFVPHVDSILNRFCMYLLKISHLRVRNKQKWLFTAHHHICGHQEEEIRCVMDTHME